jgi:hypothetical protein
MFFSRKKEPNTIAQSATPKAVWDEKTTARIAESERLDVRITHVMKRWGFGSYSSGGLCTPLEYEIRGVITSPKLLAVTVTIDNKEGEQFGGWFYHILGIRDGETPKPFLDLWVHDPKFTFAEAVYQAHRDAMISGERKSDVRFWKRKGDGLMTEEERVEGYSQSFPLVGALVWAYVESKTLPPWAAPMDSEKYSADKAPAWYDADRLL